MNYPAQSNIWRLDHANRHSSIGSQKGKSRVFGHFRQVFPLNIFPDELIVEELRIVHIQNNGPWSKVINSIMATDIACVYASNGPFFGHIHVQSLTGGPEIRVENLKRGDVLEIRSLVEGIALNAREGLRVEGQDLESERLNLIRAGSVVT